MAGARRARLTCALGTVEKMREAQARFELLMRGGSCLADMRAGLAFLKSPRGQLESGWFQ
ncbi:hypothetical protein DF105_03730 [Burkholderia stagnalis]|nr:hypothetical protein DF164_16605 [Burkholderia stagnalis]RQY43865.1 hypothetical protein DF113_08655 [Burkholderia stagnalis]RQZ02375.1 hypothetical protein DF106_03440 [Burkholderia stagnalis]RQZ08386.1 hypothetical protein DF105_03730 [Burkholderia stagnalis]